MIAGVDWAECQSLAAMVGVKEGVGERRVWVDRARRMSWGAFGRWESWFRKAEPTPPTPVLVLIRVFFLSSSFDIRCR